MLCLRQQLHPRHLFPVKSQHLRHRLPRSLSLNVGKLVKGGQQSLGRALAYGHLIPVFYDKNGPLLDLPRLGRRFVRNLLPPAVLSCKADGGQRTLAAWDIVEGTPFAIDTGTFCEDMNFMYIAAFGAFTEVSYLTSQDRKNLLGHQAYMLEGVKSLAGLKPYHMKVEWDGQVLEEDFAFGMVTNTISVGGFKGLVNQSVALNDGLFEVLLIRMPRTPVDLSNIISYMFLQGRTQRVCV